MADSNTRNIWDLFGSVKKEDSGSKIETKTSSKTSDGSKSDVSLEKVGTTEKKPSTSKCNDKPMEPTKKGPVITPEKTKTRKPRVSDRKNTRVRAKKSETVTDSGQSDQQRQHPQTDTMDSARGPRNWSVDFSQLKNRLKLPCPKYSTGATHTQVKPSPVRNGSPFHLEVSAARIPSPAHQNAPIQTADSSIRQLGIPRISSSESVCTEEPLDLSKKRKLSEDMAPLDLSVKKETASSGRQTPILSTFGTLLNVPFSPVRPKDSSVPFNPRDSSVNVVRGKTKNLFDSIGTVDSTSSPVRRVSPVRPHIGGIPVVTKPQASSQRISLPTKRTSSGVIASQRASPKSPVIITSSALHQSGAVVSQLGATSSCPITVLNVPRRNSQSPKAHQLQSYPISLQTTPEQRTVPTAQVRPISSMIRTASTVASAVTVSSLLSSPIVATCVTNQKQVIRFPVAPKSVKTTLSTSTSLTAKEVGTILPLVTENDSKTTLATANDKPVKKRRKKKQAIGSNIQTASSDTNMLPGPILSVKGSCPAKVILHCTSMVNGNVKDVPPRNPVVPETINSHPEIPLVPTQLQVKSTSYSESKPTSTATSQVKVDSSSNPAQANLILRPMSSQVKVESASQPEDLSVSLQSTISTLSQMLSTSAPSTIEQSQSAEPIEVITIPDSPVPSEKSASQELKESQTIEAGSPKRKLDLPQDSASPKLSSPRMNTKKRAKKKKVPTATLR